MTFIANNERRQYCFIACQRSLRGEPCPCTENKPQQLIKNKMRLQITYLVENPDWSDEEHEEKSERTVILEHSDIINAIEQLIVLEEGEFIDDLYSAKEVNR